MQEIEEPAYQDTRALLLSVLNADLSGKQKKACGKSKVPDAVFKIISHEVLVQKRLIKKSPKNVLVLYEDYFFFAAAFLTGFFASGFFAAAFFAAAMCIPPPTGKGYKFL